MATKTKLKNTEEMLFLQLRQCSDYRGFLQTYLEVRGLSHSDLARAAGFGRGFPGDVISGKRRLTAKSFPPFETALKLPVVGRKFFRYLVAADEPHVIPDLTAEEARLRLEELRNKTWQRNDRKVVQEETSSALHQLLKDGNAMAAYAASGSPETGATFEKISERTRLPNLVLHKDLQRLTEVGLLQRDGNVYYSKGLHLFLKTADRSQLLSSLFQKAAVRAHRRVALAADSRDEFFFTSQFCVRESAMPALKAALRETILKFVDDAIETEGDRVVSLLTSFHR